MEKHLNKIIHMLGFRTFLIIVLLITGLLQFLFMVGNIRSVTYDIEPFELAPETIRAVKTVEDTEKTEEEQNQAASQITPEYVFDDSVVEHRIAFISSIFDIILDIRSSNEKTTDLSTQVNQLKEKLKELSKGQSNFALTDTQLKSLLTTDEKNLQEAKTYLVDEVSAILKDPIRKENVSTIQNQIEDEILTQSQLDESILTAVAMIGRAAIIETEVVDQEKTNELIQQAKESVEPTRILQGQIIVQEGEVVDQEVYRQLELLGLLNNNPSMKPVIGLIIFIFIQMSFIYGFFNREITDVNQKGKSVIVISIVYLMSLLLMELFNLLADEFDYKIAFLYPTALATMLVWLLSTEKNAILISILTSASAGVIFQEGYSAVLQMDIALYILFGSMASLIFMGNIEKRSHLLKASGLVTTVNLLFITFYFLMTQSFTLMEILFYVIAAITSGILSGALTMGLLPFFESGFGMLSTMRLIELSNPNHPLLKKLLTETPGTYHHSLMVANLAEASCEAIGADGLLARVGCYYHDIGKTKRPAFFIENQMSGINPHDSLPPERSAEIIIAHTTDGAKMLHQYKMPQEIIDIALQHHGTSSLRYFLHKAREKGGEVDEQKFHYPGPKPKTKEAAVVSISDSVEAAVRSMKHPNPQNIQELVHSIIRGKLQENQFDECDISIKELKIIEKVLCETLNGTFHSRIEYPKEDKQEEDNVKS